MDPRIEALANLAADYHAKVQAHNDATRAARDLDERAGRAWDAVNTAAGQSRAALQALATYAETMPPAETVDAP